MSTVRHEINPDNGDHRICTDAWNGPFEAYKYIATTTDLDNTRWYGVTEYYAELFPVNTPFKILTVADCEKIMKAIIEIDEMLDPDDNSHQHDAITELIKLTCGTTFEG